MMTIIMTEKLCLTFIYPQDFLSKCLLFVLMLLTNFSLSSPCFCAVFLRVLDFSSCLWSLLLIVRLVTWIPEVLRSCCKASWVTCRFCWVFRPNNLADRGKIILRSTLSPLIFNAVNSGLKAWNERRNCIKRNI